MSMVVTEDRGPVRHVVLNRPEKRDAMNQELLRELGEALRAAACVVHLPLTVSAVCQSLSVVTVSAWPSRNLMTSVPIRPAGFGVVPPFSAATASTLVPARSIDLMSSAEATWKLSPLPVLRPLTDRKRTR